MKGLKLGIVISLLSINVVRAQKSQDNWNIYQYAHTINYADHKVVFHLGVAADKNAKAEPDKTYTWHSANQLHNTQGGYAGKLLQGQYKDFYPNGELKESGLYRDGLKIGLWKFWREGGQLESDYSFSSGTLNGPFHKFDSDGKLLVEGRFDGGLVSGKQISYFSKDSTTVEYYKKGIAYQRKPFIAKRLWKKIL